jgi:hypothetical protein
MNDWVNERMWITGGMTITGKNRSTGRKLCPSINFRTANPALTDLRISSGPPGDRATINQVSHSTVR